METGISPQIFLTDEPVDFVIVTALAEERDAVLSRLQSYHQLPPAITNIHTYYQANLPVTFSDQSTGSYRIIVTCLMGMGQTQAVVAAKDAIDRWKPRYILLIGIAGGIANSKVKIGDVLIVDQIVNYEQQKITEEKAQVRWDVQRADPRLLEACNNFRDESWHSSEQTNRPDPGRPSRYTGPIASGDKVIAFSEILVDYRTVWPKLLGVEMEASGVATAAFQSAEQQRPGFFMVRGVSDLADENKGTEDVEKWRTYACNIAASFAISFLKSGPIPLSGKRSKVVIFLEGNIREFNPSDLVIVLGAMLKIDPINIRVLKVQEGSIIVSLEMPEIGANRLYALAADRDLRVMKLGIQSIFVEGRERVNLTEKGGYYRWEMLPAGNTHVSYAEGFQAAIHEVDNRFSRKEAYEIPLGASLFRELLVNSYNALQYLPQFPYLEQVDNDAPAEFYDRRVLMENIRSRKNSTRVFELNGPSGIGKKHVLRALKEEKDREWAGISDDLWDRWLYAWADGESQNSYEQIMATFTTCLGGANHARDPIDALARCLMAQSRVAGLVQKINVLFFLDNADKLAPEVLVRLAGEDGPVGNRIWKSLASIAGAQQVFFLRLVVTSRRPRLNQSFCSAHKLLYIRPHSMEPLDVETVSDMVRKSFMQILGRPNDEQWNNSVSEQLVRVSGGHPSAIYQIIEQLKLKFFAVQPDAIIEEYRSSVLYMIQRDIIGDLSLKEYLLLNVLSVFRFIHSSLIEELMKRGLLPDDIIPETVDNQPVTGMRTNKWLNEFCETTGLIYRSKKGSSQLYRVHPVLQPILLMDLKIRSEMPLKLLCREAYAIHHDCLTANHHGIPSMDLDPWVMAALSSIYHLAQGLEILPKEQRDCTEILARAKEYREMFIEMVKQKNNTLFSENNLLYDTWEQDTELQEMIRGLDVPIDLVAEFNNLFTIV